jgi:hypothetical protein|eukprot:COSAG01_NODE_5475_length_4236_cov_1111.481267_5_plen_33_part_00
MMPVVLIALIANGAAAAAATKPNIFLLLTDDQ